MELTRYRPVLKYPGSKWNLSEEIIKLIPKHHTYLEPFFGSGAIFFRKGPSDIELINDIDNDVINLFNCIREDSEKLARIILTTPYSRKIYDTQYENIVLADDYERAAGFLVKCWQGHGFRTNGYKVGWKNDVQGREKMYALWNWYRLPEWVIEIAERLRQVQIECSPALDVIRRFNYRNVFMFLDPPYLLSTRAAKQYKHEMTKAQHEILLQECTSSKAMIMICGYKSELYNSYLKNWHQIKFEATAEYGLKRIEYIWMNFKPCIDEQISIFDLEY